MKASCIAHSIFNRQIPMYSFTENMARNLADSKNVIYHNRNMEKQIAYFRYGDGSAIHLSGNVAFWVSPCPECKEPASCNCNCKFDLRKREGGNVIDINEPVEELDL